MSQIEVIREIFWELIKISPQQATPSTLRLLQINMTVENFLLDET